MIRGSEKFGCDSEKFWKKQVGREINSLPLFSGSNLAEDGIHLFSTHGEVLGSSVVPSGLDACSYFKARV